MSGSAWAHTAGIAVWLYLTVWLAFTRRRYLVLLRRLQYERTVLGVQGWRCPCGRMTGLDRRASLSDKSGMLHGPDGCEPDLDGLV